MLQNKKVFCTLFDTNYLDKGLALYKSMNKQMISFRLYIFAFDDKCFEILNKMRLKNVILLSVKDIMTDRLQKIRTERTNAEFCWTCTPLIIEYVLLQCKEMICTYIDADIYFFSDPEDIIQEIINNECSVGLVKHGFERNWEYGRQIFELGKYCIEFNTFLNNRYGIQVLKDWKEQCLNWCYYRVEDRKLGDQKYPDGWKQKYTSIHESQNLGAGIAPWNLHLYLFEKNVSGEIWGRYKERKFPLVFYHFEGMKYLSNRKIYLNLWEYCRDKVKGQVKLLYGQYFNDITDIRKYLKDKYNVTFDHMCIDKKEFLQNYSLKRFCVEDGLLDGLKGWIGFRKNNIVRINKIEIRIKKCLYKKK